MTSQSFQKYTGLNAHNLSRKYSQGKCKRVRALKGMDEEDEKSRRKTVSGANLPEPTEQSEVESTLHNDPQTQAPSQCAKVPCRNRSV